MNSFWRGVDWQFPQKLDRQPLHFNPVSSFSLFNSQDGYQASA